MRGPLNRGHLKTSAIPFLRLLKAGIRVSALTPAFSAQPIAEESPSRSVPQVACPKASMASRCVLRASSAGSESAGPEAAATAARPSFGSGATAYLVVLMLLIILVTTAIILIIMISLCLAAELGQPPPRAFHRLPAGPGLDGPADDVGERLQGQNIAKCAHSSNSNT